MAHRETSARIFRVALPVTAETGSNPSSPIAAEWINQWWHIRHYSTSRAGTSERNPVTCSHRNKISQYPLSKRSKS